VTPVVEIDGYRVGDGAMGPLTSQLQTAYFDVVRGRAEAPAGWRTSVYRERVPA